MGESGYTLGFRRKIAHSGSHAETGAFPPPATVRLCAASEIFYSATLLYTYISRFSVNPHHRQKRKSRRRCHRNSVLNRFSSRFLTSPTNGPRSLSQTKMGTHSALGERSHTRAHTAKQVAFRMGVVSLPSERSARSQTSPGRVSERQTLPLLGLGRVYARRTQKACGTAMRLCASLFRGVAAPLGCVILLPLLVQPDLLGWKDLTKRSGRVTITRNNRTDNRLALVWKPFRAVK